MRAMIRRSASGSAMRTGDSSARAKTSWAVSARCWAAMPPISATHPDSRRGLARARALEHVAHVAVVVLERAGQVRMAGPRPRDREIRIPVLGPGRHLLLPVAPVPVLDPECDGRPERLAPAYAGADLDLVLLDLHAAAAPVALHAAGQISVDGRDVDRHPRREPLDDGGQSGPVRLPGGQVAQRHLIRLADAPATAVRRTAALPCPRPRSAA